MSGNSAQAYGARLARVEVISAYPITPQTTIVEKLADFTASGDLPAQYVKVESEHSAMQACISASALGARTYTATSSQGLLLMHELLHWASGSRLPIVMGVANRAVAPPLSLGADHTDTMSQRDTGWIQFYAETNQEVLDTVVECFRLCEDDDIMLPAMVMEDAFFLTHTVEPVDVPPQGDIDKFLHKRRPKAKIELNKVNRFGSWIGPEGYMEFRKRNAATMARVPQVFKEVEDEYARVTGRHHGGLLPTYRTEDADTVLITIGTAATTARGVVEAMRKQGKKVGLAKLRAFRPFPVHEVLELAKDVDRLGVMDRGFCWGPAGPAKMEVAAALFEAPQRPLLQGFFAGLGGRDVTPQAVERMYDILLSGKVGEPEWVGLKTRSGVASHA